MMPKYDWENECLYLKDNEAYSYRCLAEKYGVTVSIINMVLYRLRHPEYSRAAYFRKHANARSRALLKRRVKDAARVLKRIPSHKEAHRKIVLGYAAGLNNRECGEYAGCSYTWANVILRRYGLNTHDRIKRTVRERIENEDRGSAGLQISPKAKKNTGRMGNS